MVFGDVAPTRPWHDDPSVEVHGPGYSKLLLKPDAAAEWTEHLDVIVSSVAENGGRSCVNASGVWTTSRGGEIAEGLAADGTVAVDMDPLSLLTRLATSVVLLGHYRRLGYPVGQGAGGAMFNALDKPLVLVHRSCRCVQRTIRVRHLRSGNPSW